MEALLPCIPLLEDTLEHLGMGCCYSLLKVDKEGGSGGILS